MPARGAPQIVLEPRHGRAAREVPFRLPANARQGPKAWYALELRFRLAFHPRTRPGFAWFGVLANRWGSALYEFTIRRARTGLYVRRTTRDIVKGFREHTARSLTSTSRFRNYVPYRGIRPGSNTLTFKLEHTRGVRVAEAKVLSARIVRTSRTPFPLEVTTGREDGAGAKEGERVAIAVTLSNRTGEEVRDVVLRVRADRALEPVSAPPVRLRTLTRPIRIRYVFRALRPGSHRVVFSAQSSRNDPVRPFEVHVDARGGDGRDDLLFWVLALLPFAAATALWARGWMRQRASSAEAQQA